MKTIPLKTLVEKISKLAWKRYGGQIRNDLFLVAAGSPNRGKNIPSVTEKANLDYIVHCCNHFPELVEALKWVRGSLLEHSKQSRACGYNFTVSLQEIDRALASAETVQIED